MSPETCPDCFSIQAGDPMPTGEFEPQDETLLGAMETVFSAHTEDIVVRWHSQYFTLNYKYTFSWMIDSLLDLLAKMHSEEGDVTLQWSPQEFFHRWRLRWWSHGGLMLEWLDCQDAFSPLRLPKQQFMSEWKRPLAVCRDSLVKAGYRSSQIAEMELLEQTLAGLEEEGLLYRGLPGTWPVDGSPPQLPPGFRAP